MTNYPLTPIPADIMQDARRALNKIHTEAWDDYDEVVHVIAAAIKEERERCAHIAEGNYDHIGVRTKHDKCPHERFGWEDCDQCAAAAIRGATP